MTPRPVIFSVVAVTLALGATAPALASNDSYDAKRYCVALSSDPERQEYAPICVWVPGSSDAAR